MNTTTSFNIDVIHKNPSAFRSALVSATCSYINLEHKLVEFVKDIVKNGFPLQEKPCISNRFEYDSKLSKLFGDAAWGYEQTIFINEILGDTNQNELLGKLRDMMERESVEEVFDYYETQYFWTEERKIKHNEECNKIANEVLAEILAERKGK